MRQELPGKAMNGLKLAIGGDAVPWGRPGATTRGGHARLYEKAGPREYKTACRWTALEAMKGRPLFDGPLQVTIDIYRMIPKSFSAKKRQLAIERRIFPITKPDAENYAKLLLDAMNKTVYVDDARVVALLARKFYAEKPRVDILVERL